MITSCKGFKRFTMVSRKAQVGSEPAATDLFSSDKLLQDMLPQVGSYGSP